MPRPMCPVCGEEGDSFHGTARGAVYHFMHRTVWQLHELRRAAEHDGQGELAAYVSGRIRELEDLVRRLFEDRRH